jgi:BCD family chlorophyll transporter-like MFS transporter
MSPLGWFGIIRLGLVQTALGTIVVLTTSLLNRVMVVELALPAMLPGALVGLHYAVQVLRPRWGYGSDVGGRQTGWIVAGMAVLAVGGVLAAMATALMVGHLAYGIALAVIAFLMIGMGVGIAGTTLLVVLAKRVEAKRRAAAATIVWVMMIAGFIVTTAIAGHLLDPFSLERLMAVSLAVSLAAMTVTLGALWRLEGHALDAQSRRERQTLRAHASFRVALLEIWSEPQSRKFAVFLFISMLAYSSQDLILEPFAGSVFAMSPGQSTQLASFQHGGVLVGMVLVAVLVSAVGEQRVGSLQAWTIGGCVMSAGMLALLAFAGVAVPSWPLRANVFALGLANGIYAVAAIGSMMGMASAGRPAREGVRMGLWGAAQGVAFGLGGFIGAAASDAARFAFGEPLTAYAIVFSAEAALFLVAACLARQLNGRLSPSRIHVAAPTVNSAQSETS